MKTGKRRFLILGLSLGLILLTAGVYFVVAAETAGDGDLYYPMKLRNTWLYKTTYPDNKIIAKKLVVTESKAGSSEISFFYFDQPVAQVFFNRNAQGLIKVKEILSSENFKTIKVDPPQLILPFKLNVGVSWSWQSSDKKSRENAKVLANEKVTVPAGTFDAVVVQYDGVTAEGKPYTSKTWYAKGVGYVKDVYTEDKQTMISELADYQVQK